jgi:hypothetical protein
MTRFGPALLSVPLAVCAACGGDPVSYSAPVGISLKAKSGDTVGGMVATEKSITTESGNPYGAFIGDARARIGRDPVLVDVEGVELALGAGSVGVAALGDVFAGTVEVVFQMNDTNNAHRVATAAVDAGTAAGPIALDVVFNAEAVPDLDYVRLLNGSFKVITRGPAAPGFESKGADVDLEVTLTFAAFE